MPRGSWSILVAVSGWLILSGQHPNPATQSEQAQADSRIADALTNIARTYDQQAKDAERAPENDPCRPGEDQRDSDLCAQWKAADAAADAAWWAAFAGWFGGLSFLGVLAAIGLAFHSNWIARDTAKRQLRAYVSVEPGGIHQAENGMHQVPLNLINTGQTPAHGLEVFGDFLVVSGDPRLFNPEADGRFSGDLASSDQTLGADTSRWSFAYLQEEVPRPFLAKIAAKEAAIIHYGFLQYKDVFGHTWKTAFAFYHWGEELSDAQSKRCRFGNYST